MAGAGYLPERMTQGPPPAEVITPYKVPLSAGAEEHERARQVRRAHPLFRDVSLRLLTEVINSRLFTTVGLPCPPSRVRCMRRCMNMWSMLLHGC